MCPDGDRTLLYCTKIRTPTYYYNAYIIIHYNVFIVTLALLLPQGIVECIIV
jgi:hypothetical protein